MFYRQNLLHICLVWFSNDFRIVCPRAELAFTFLLDKKSKQKNQENLILPPTFPRHPAPNFLSYTPLTFK